MRSPRSIGWCASGWSPRFDAYLAAEAIADRTQGLVHGDYRLDNMLFGRPGADRPLTVVDWQTVTWGPAFTDVAYFLGCALPVDVAPQALRRVADRLSQGARGRTAGGPRHVRDGVRRQSFFGVMMAIVSSMLVERTERGDQMFMTMLRAALRHVLDTGALAVLPDAATPEPLQPRASRRGPARAGRRAAVERELVLRLRRRPPRGSAAGSGSA